MWRKARAERAATAPLGRPAFSLIETLLLIAMFSVAVILFISYTSDLSSVSADAASWKIQADIRHAQQLAKGTGVPHGVLFEQHGSYTVYREGPAQPVADPLGKNPMVVDLKQFGEVTIANRYQVEFDRDGRPAIGGGGWVDVISDSGSMRRVRVMEDTGGVIVDVLGESPGCGLSAFRI